jgi:hypothetical protein
MAGSSAPLMYWAVRTILCSTFSVGCQAVAIPSSDAASQDARNSAAVEDFEDLRAHDKSFQPPEVEEVLSCPLHDFLSHDLPSSRG